MKKFTLFFCLITSILYAQTFNLEWQNPKPVGNNLLDFYAFSSTNILAVGGSSVFVRSNDAGNTFSLSYPDTSRNDIWGVCFVNSNLGFICGAAGLIMKTTDGGNTWAYKTSGVTGILYDIEFMNADSGLAVGASGNVLRTTNGGETWTATTYGTSAIYKIFIVNKNLVYIGSANASGRLAISTDFGLSWTNASPASLTSTVYGIYFLNNTTGWISTGTQGIMYTNDGGTNWTQQISVANIVYDVKFINSTTGFASDSRGIIYSTTNGGTNWTSTATSTRNALRSITYKAPNIYIVGDAGNFFMSSDNGANWIRKSQVAGQAQEFQRRVIFINNTTGFVCGGSSTASDSLGYILKTTNGGQTWTALPFNPKTQIYSISVPTENVIYIGCAANKIFKSTDGGNTFTEQTPPTTGATWWEIQFCDVNNGYAGGGSGLMVKTTNGGTTWTSVTNPFSTSTIYSMKVFDPQTVIAVGSSARAHKTTDGGATWTTLVPQVPGTYFIVRFIDNNIGYIGAFTSPLGYVTRTTDGGATWTPLLTYPGTQSVWGVAPKDANTVFVVDLNGWIYYSTDAGNTWASVKRVFGPNVFYCSYAGDALYISGSNGTIIKGSFGTPTQTKTVSYTTDWNILSVPLLANNMAKTSLFPAAVTPAYGYSGGYVTVDTLRNGRGYWMKFNSAGSVDITGQKVSPSTINLSADWNIIGPFDIDVAVSGITTTPPGIIASNFYGFNNGYFNATTLSMGKGYWVKLSQAGTLNLPSSVLAKSDDKNELERNWGKINITDAVGNKITLFVGKDISNPEKYELPPIPPQGIFDVRYESNRMVELFSADEKLIRINSAIYPIRISLKGIELRIIDKVNGKLVDRILKNGDELYLDNEQIKLLGVQFINMPFEFALYQNYPNPFNPITKIKFQIPNKEKVKLTLFNVLGEVVAELVNRELEAGFHEVEFNANKYSSGVYIYKLETTHNSAINKMMFLK